MQDEYTYIYQSDIIFNVVRTIKTGERFNFDFQYPLKCQIRDDDDDDDRKQRWKFIRKKI